MQDWISVPWPVFKAATAVSIADTTPTVIPAITEAAGSSPA